jgi:hypothetical protein
MSCPEQGDPRLRSSAEGQDILVGEIRTGLRTLRS